MTQEEIEAFFLNHNEPHFENILDHDTDDEAFLHAAFVLMDGGHGTEVSLSDLLAVVLKILQSS